MNYPVKWLPEAETTYELIIAYLDENWSQKQVNTFIDRTDEVINFISQNPRQYAYSNKKGIFRAVVTSQISLYYQIKSEEVELLIFWDTRQYPNKLKI